MFTCCSLDFALDFSVKKSSSNVLCEESKDGGGGSSQSAFPQRVCPAADHLGVGRNQSSVADFILEVNFSQRLKEQM